MSIIKDLTKDEFTAILDGYFATSKKRTQMTQEEVQELAEVLNEKVNIPIITEPKEETILIKIIVKIDNFLYDNLPNEFYDSVRSLHKGIDETEAKRLIKRLSELANRKINIPYIPEAAEFIAIRFVIGIIINAARENWDFKTAKQNAPIHNKIDGTNNFLAAESILAYD